MRWADYVLGFFRSLPDPKAEGIDVDAAIEKLKVGERALIELRAMTYREASVDRLRAVHAMQQEFTSALQALRAMKNAERSASRIVLPEARA